MMRKQLIVLTLCLAVLLALCCVPSQADTIYANTTTWENKTYEASGALQIYNRIVVNGTATLQLNSGSQLTCVQGITVGEGSKLIIQGSGELIVGQTGQVGQYNAGIGGENGSAGEIEINGGTITVTGGEGGAGIGGGKRGGGTITINGGTVTASGGEGGAGIGGGLSSGAAVTITGGTVTAYGGNYDLCSGIGGGWFSESGTITITGGTVNAESGPDGAGIGGKGGSVTISGGTVPAVGTGDGAGIGGIRDSGPGSITITGGTVNASSAKGAGIGGGSNSQSSGAGNGGTISILGGKVTASSENGYAIGPGRNFSGSGNDGNGGTVILSWTDMSSYIKAASIIGETYTLQKEFAYTLYDTFVDVVTAENLPNKEPNTVLSPYEEGMYLSHCGDNLTYLLINQDSNVKHLKLYGYGPMWDFGSGASYFHDDTKLHTIIFMKKDDGITHIGDYAFENCTNLLGWDPGSTTSLQSIGTGAFIGCSQFFGTNADGFPIISSMSHIGEGAFGNCVSIRKFTLADDNHNFAIVDNALYDGALTRLIAYPPANTATTCVIPEGVTRIGDYAFCNCKNLTRIEVPASVTEIGAHAFENVDAEIVLAEGICIESMGAGAFANCTSMKGHITLGKQFTSIPVDLFNGCSGLTGITFPDTLTYIHGGAFKGCTGLTEITFPESLERVYGGAFQDCTNLTVPNGIPAKEIAADAFNGCTSLTSLTFPDDMTCILDRAFANCTGLTDVVLPACIGISGNGIFMNCTNLAHVMLPDGQYSGDGESMFSGCSSLTNINIPLYITAGNVVPTEYCKDCTSLVTARVAAGTETIKASAFSGCTSLTSITLPPELTAVEDGAFQNCNALTDVYFGGTAERWNNIKDSFPTGVTVHYVDDYQPFLNVIVTPCEHGTVTAEWQRQALQDGVYYNSFVQLTVTPDTGYQLKSLTVTNSHGENVDTSWQRNIFRFYHIYEYVTVTAEFEPVSGGGTEANPRQITAEDLPTTLYSGWYAVTENVTSYTTVMIRGDVHLILNAGTTLRARAGVNVSEGNSLAISGSGTLNTSHGTTQAGIGSNIDENAGTITINSGTIFAAGYSSAAAIGGGHSGSGGTITINGGTVMATGSGPSAVIGGGSGASGGTIIINGGTISATCAEGGAAIGNGKNYTGTEGSITIADGLKVTVAGAEAPALAADRVSACAENEVTVTPCGHEDEVVLSAAGETSCAHCGTAAPVPSFGSGTASDPWKINSTGRWNAVASAIENGLATSGKYFSLTENISVTTMMGLANRPFSGVFDGNGKTLTFTSEDHPEYTAPFRYTSSATIRNLHVTGSITGTNIRAAGLIGENSGTTTVTNCRVSATLSGSRLIGGFCIGTGNNLSITGCVFDGKITGNPDQSGCFVAWGTSGLSITDSIAAPKSGSAFTGGTFCHEGSTPTLTNCYYLTAFETVQGKQARSVTFAEGVTADFGMSSAAYSVSGITVYPAGLKYGSKFCAGAGDSVTMGLNCTAVPEGSALLRYDVDSGTLTKENGAWTLTLPDADVVISAVFAPAFGTPDFTLPAAITTVEEEAFEGAGMSVVLVPATCTTVGARAFKDCGSLWQIQIPAGCAIGADAFEGCTLVYVYSAAGSPAETYCQGHENCVFVEE